MSKYEVTVHMDNGTIERFYIYAETELQAENVVYSERLNYINGSAGFIANLRLCDN